jgi:hypothetical protein
VGTANVAVNGDLAIRLEWDSGGKSRNFRDLL